MHNRCRNRAAPIHGYDTNLAQWYHLLYFYSKNKRVHRASISESPAFERLPPKTNTPKPSFQKCRFRSRAGQLRPFFRPAPIHFSKNQPLPRSASRITTSATGLYRHNHTSERPLCRLSAFFRTFLTSLVFQFNFIAIKPHFPYSQRLWPRLPTAAFAA